MYRLRGTLLNATGDPVAAEQNYRQAITVAQLQSAKPFELRTSIGLARILREQGRHAEAHDLLASIYGWFAGGLDAPDLKEAKALLDMRAS
ncbi:tetratricopeptide repeat protein [Bradyrhizobium sp. ISRA435]|nr:tetratricopeptide repeat protein [Bradyrhizobium sp. ISRA435]